MARAKGRNASPVRRAVKPSTVCRKIEVRKMVPTRMPVTPSMTDVPETRVSSFQMWGGNRGRSARCSSLRKVTKRTNEAVNAVAVCTLHQPVGGGVAGGAVDPEDELPAGPGGDGAPEEHAGGDPEAANSSPHGERRRCQVRDDGDLITSAGVSAGIDMALHLVARLAGTERAREVRRGIQYDSHPPV